MTNREALRRFQDNTHCAVVSKLYWIAGSLDDSDFKEMLADLDEKGWAEILPDIRNSEYFDDYQEREEMGQALVDYGKFGLIAEVHHPECRDFKFDKKGSVSSCSISRGICRIGFVYAEDLAGLMEAVEKQSAEIYQDYIEKDKRPKKKSAVKR